MALSSPCRTSAKSVPSPIRFVWPICSVPVLIQATPDDPKKMTIAFRRDSFCGKMSACNNLRQYGIPYSITTLHTEAPDSPEFAKDLEWFAGVCRVVNGFRNLRVGAIGARPTAFNTVRYSEKILESHGISIETLDLSEVLGRIGRMKDNDDAAQGSWRRSRSMSIQVRCRSKRLMKMAKLGAVVDQWMAATEVAISAVQCWTSHRREPRRRPLHRDEHDERQPAIERVRGGYLRRAWHACLAPGLGHAFRAAGLEQQLRDRSEQGRLLPLLESAQTLLPLGKDGFPGNHRRHCWEGEHLRHLRGTDQAGEDELRAFFHR